MHAEREFKRVVQEPSFADRESEYAAAQRQTLIPGLIYLGATMGVCQVMIARFPKVSETLAMAASPAWLLPAWLLLLWLVVATCAATAALAFQGIAGKTYSQHTPAFAAAGGYDIARWVPLLCYVLLYGIYASSLRESQADHLAIIRDPWLFLAIGAGVGHIATWLVARRLFHSRFAKSP